MMPTMEIGGRRIGPDHPTYIVAEMSSNHGGDFDRALEILRSAKAAGADAVKLQTYTADTMTIPCQNEYFQISGTPWQGRTLYDLYSQAFTPWDWQPKLKKAGEQLGLHVFSSPFDPSAVDFLEEMGVPAYKVASFELVDLPLIRKMAQTGKPLILSTGMATLEEIRDALEEARHAGATQIGLLKCTSAYPAPPEEMNLRLISHLAETFEVPVGLSDHTLGTTVPAVAVALGACIIEKHFTLSRSIQSPDSAFSLEPSEFKAMVDSVRIAERALGHVRYEIGPNESTSRVFRRSLFVVEDVKKGEILSERNVRSIRPGYGMPPKCLVEVLGRRAARDISRGTPLTRDLII